MHTIQLQQYTQDYNNTHKTTNNNTHKKTTTIHTKELQQYTQNNYNNTHKTTKKKKKFASAKPTEPFPVQIPQHFSNLDILHTYPPMKMEQTECSETSAYKFQTPWNYPEESIQHSEHGESLNSRLNSDWFYVFKAKCCVPRLGDRLRTRS